MKSRELMSRNLSYCVPEERLLDALKTMEAGDIGSVPIVASRSDLRPVGVITDRDAALYLGRNDRRPSEVMCRDVMSSPVVVCDIEDDVSDVFDRMRQYQLRRILITENGRLCGVIAQADVAREKPGDAKKVVEDVSQPKAA